MRPPIGWSEAETMSEVYELLDGHEYLADTMDALAAEIVIDQRRAFYVGVLYGMALESGKDEPLVPRLDRRGEL